MSEVRSADGERPRWALIVALLLALNVAGIVLGRVMPSRVAHTVFPLVAGSVGVAFLVRDGIRHPRGIYGALSAASFIGGWVLDSIWLKLAASALLVLAAYAGPRHKESS